MIVPTLFHFLGSREKTYKAQTNPTAPLRRTVFIQLLTTMAKALKCAALAVLAASSAEAFTGSAFTGMTPKLRTSAVSTRAAATVGPDMSLVLVTGAR